MTNIANLFPYLDDEILYLLANDVELDCADCSGCGCPIFRFYVLDRHHLGLRCAGCGSVQRGFRGRLVQYSVGGDVLRAIAHENRWQRALYSVEKDLGEWWMHSTGYGAWCSRVAN
jgi:hypothetical protein